MCRSLHDEVAGRRDDEAGETCCGGDRFIQRGRIDNGKHITVAMENVGFSSVCPFRIGISTRNGPAARAVGTAAALVEWIHLKGTKVNNSLISGSYKSFRVVIDHLDAISIDFETESVKSDEISLPLERRCLRKRWAPWE